MSPSLTASQVAHWLAEHPDFFEGREALLDKLHVPHPLHGGAVSLLEYQVASARAKADDSTQALSALSQGARQQKGSHQRLQQVLLALMDADSADALAQQLALQLDEHYGVTWLSLWRDATPSAPCHPPTHGLNQVIVNHIHAVPEHAHGVAFVPDEVLYRRLQPEALGTPCPTRLVELPLGSRSAFLVLSAKDDTLDRTTACFLADVVSRLLERHLS
ncbi:DUF484 family protein [Larsenimonas salina]|uniref:DUF484 family protein n=1 Tax=Larsenimonas salina TaxID=1295565 RepID=UPI0020741B27|nr:DUF484 family protein [Larsenimonas salina]MCM5705242.1 DUF484 family protein [Larsenimonas salina]